MTHSAAIGVTLTILAGMLSGNCMLPMKFARTWKWENLWAVFSVVSLIVLPWVLALTLVDRLGEVYRLVPLHDLAIPFLLGAGWGIAQILFGISVVRLGLGVAYAVIVGLGAIFGTLVPLFAGQHQAVSRGVIWIVLGGVVVMVLGIALTTWGGHLRERSLPGNESSIAGKSYLAAILLAILCGLMAPMLNYSFAFGQEIAHIATRLGNSPYLAAYAVWPVGLAGGFLPNAAYSLSLLRRNQSWSLFSKPNPDMLLASLMGVLWMGAFALYGMSAVFLGVLGTSVGWGLFQIFMIMTATLFGVLTGEWKNARRPAIVFLVTGLTCLVLATWLLALGSAS